MSRWWQVTLTGTYVIRAEIRTFERGSAIEKAMDDAEQILVDADRALRDAGIMLELSDGFDVDECSGPSSAPSDVDGDDYY
jgi:hypothetical protein